MRAQLVPLDGGAPIEIVRDLTLVGRREDCDLRLDHKSVSKMHCVLVKTDGMLFLRDLGSTNGTRVNGMRVRRAALLPNDQLHIANYKYRVQLGPDEPSPPAAGGGDDHTQQLDANEVADLLRKAREKALEDSSADGHASPPVQANPLPDVYPDDNGPAR
jgi:pSer/pThr/pTyr-binding forkhead associated (FHA) protein